MIIAIDPAKKAEIDRKAVPVQVTNFQARALLMNMPGSAPGRSLFDDVNETLRGMGGVEWQAWEYTTVIPRDSVLVAAIAAQFKLTQAQIDEMFIAASAISN
jgi:response regulator RpfG family c-di-GMP phosphodiesterase